MSTLTMERRVSLLDVRATPKGREVTAAIVTYGVVDEYNTVFVPGCFTASLAARMPRIALGHDWTRVIGVWRTVVEDNAKRTVLRGVLSDPSRVPDAATAMALLEDGSLDQVSVGFMPEEMTDVKVGGKTVPGFAKARLDEVSLVLTGAVPGAEVLSVRGRRVRPVNPAAAEALMLVARHRGIAQARGETRIQTADIDAALALVRARTGGRR
jgi:HK97 family phage prohead protease